MIDLVKLMEEDLQRLDAMQKAMDNAPMGGAQKMQIDLQLIHARAAVIKNYQTWMESELTQLVIY